MPFTSVEICAGAGGQSIGLEQAGFEHLALVEIDGDACNTLRHNRPEWNVCEMDVREFSARVFLDDHFNYIQLPGREAPTPPGKK